MREDVINAVWEHPIAVSDSVLLGSLRILEPHRVQAVVSQGVQHAVILCAAQLVCLGHTCKLLHGTLYPRALLRRLLNFRMTAQF